MEVGYVTNSLSSQDGWGRYSKTIVGPISDHVDKCIVLTSRGVKNDLESEDGIEIHQVLPDGISFSFLTQFKIFYYCLKLFRQVDVIHSLMTPFSSGAALAAFVLRKRFVITLHGTYAVPPKDNSIKSIIKKCLMALTFKAAYVTTTGSPHTKQKIREVVSLKECKFIPNGVDPTKFYHIQNSKDRNFILTVGAVKPRKGADVVIKAMAELKEDLPDLRYKVVGSLGNESYVKELKNLSDELEVRDNIDFLGRVSDKELVKLYNQCSVFVLAAREDDGSFEGFPMVFYEANACGSPVISTKGFGSEYAIKDGHNGYIVEQEDYKSIADKVKTILSDKKLKEKLKRGALQEAEKHTTDKIALKILDLYK